MRRLIKWLVVVVAVTVLVVGGFLAWYVFGDRAPGRPRLSATAPKERGGPATPEGTWHVTRGTNVYAGYRIKELFGDSTLKRDAVGRTPAVSGSLVISNQRVTSVVVTADLRHLASSRAARDAFIRDNSLQSATYPTARFTLTAPIALPPRAAKGVLLHLQATGSLLLHGVTGPITLTLEARWDGPTIEVAGTAPIRLGEYKIKAPHTVIASVDDHGSVELDLRFAPGSH